MNDLPILNDKYQLTHLIGSGGFGEVYGAHDLLLKRSVAVKLLKLEISSETVAAERFLKEAQLTSQLSHPNTLNIYDFGQHEGRLFLVSELLQGESLRDRLSKIEYYSPPEMIKLFIPICSALHEAHQLGVIHRDLKPDNLFLHQAFGEERLILLDFGIAKSMGDLHLTKTGQVFGTPHYMAPEQIKESKHVDARADIYSLGVIFYEALSGIQPFLGTSMFEVFEQHIHSDIPKLAQRISPSLAPFDELLEQMLAKVPKNRLQSTLEVEKILKELNALEFESTHKSRVKGNRSNLPNVSEPLSSEYMTLPTSISNDHPNEFSHEFSKTPHNTMGVGTKLKQNYPLQHSTELDATLAHEHTQNIIGQQLETSSSLIIEEELTNFVNKDITSSTFSLGQTLVKLSGFFAFSLMLFWSGLTYYQDTSFSDLSYEKQQEDLSHLREPYPQDTLLQETAESVLPNKKRLDSVSLNDESKLTGSNIGEQKFPGQTDPLPQLVIETKDPPSPSSVSSSKSSLAELTSNVDKEEPKTEPVKSSSKNETQNFVEDETDKPIIPTPTPTSSPEEGVSLTLANGNSYRSTSTKSARSKRSKKRRRARKKTKIPKSSKIIGATKGATRHQKENTQKRARLSSQKNHQSSPIRASKKNTREGLSKKTVKRNKDKRKKKKAKEVSKALSFRLVPLSAKNSNKKKLKFFVSIIGEEGSSQEVTVSFTPRKAAQFFPRSRKVSLGEKALMVGMIEWKKLPKDKFVKIKVCLKGKKLCNSKKVKAK